MELFELDVNQSAAQEIKVIRENKKSWFAFAFAVLTFAMIVVPEVKAADADGWLTSYVASKGQVLKKIMLRKTDKGEVKIRVFATGYPDDVDWGEVTAQVHTYVGGGSPVNFVANYSVPKAKELLIINPINGSGRPGSGGDVMVELFTTFTDGRSPEYVRQSMATPR